MHFATKKSKILVNESRLCLEAAEDEFQDETVFDKFVLTLEV